MDAMTVGSAPWRRFHGCLAAFGLLAAAAMPLRAQQGEPLRVGGDVSAPRKISGDAPSYTEVARRARVSGVVIIEAVIGQHGAVTETRVLKGLPFGLDAKAVEAVKTWKFVPATFQGEPVRVYYLLTVNFHLRSDFNFGPAFSAFLSEHSEVRELVEKRDYDGAGELLDRWAVERPQDNAVRLMRAYMHLGEGEVEEAWRVAQSVTGPEQGEVAGAVADKAAEQVAPYSETPAEDRAAVVEAGLAAATRAIELAADDAEHAAGALRTKARLLRDQAGLTSDAARRQALLDEAKDLETRASQLRPAGAIFP